MSNIPSDGVPPVSPEPVKSEDANAQHAPTPAEGHPAIPPSAAQAGQPGEGTGASPESSPPPHSPESATDATDRPRIQVGKSTGPRPQDGGRDAGRPPRSGGGGGGGFKGPPQAGQRPRGPKPPRGQRPAGEGTDGENSSSAPTAPPSSKSMVPVPSKRERISPDLEAELNAALSDLALDQIVDEGIISRATQTMEEEGRHRATVVRVDKEHVFFSLGGKNEGAAPVRQFAELPEVGTELDVIVKGINPDDGLYELIVPGASIDVADWSDLSQGAVVEARVTGANTGGLEAMVNNIRGFVPASQIGLYRVENLSDFIGQKLLCIVTEVNPKRKNLVLSHRAILEREREESRKKLLEELAPGQIRDGVVKKLHDFGAFVDLGGIDGMIHVTRLSWERIKHPSEVVQEGQKVRVKVERIDEQTGKISLSYRDLLDRPWDEAEQKFPPGTTARGTVSRVANFGAFVKLAPGIEGLIHISELAHGRVRRVEDVLKEGQDVEVKVLSIDLEAQRIALSYKATLPPPESGSKMEEEPEGPPRPLAVVSKNRPLRGGTDRPTGGEGLGLNW